MTVNHLKQALYYLGRGECSLSIAHSLIHIAQAMEEPPSPEVQLAWERQAAQRYEDMLEAAKAQGVVHSHGPDEGRGMDCPETIQNGKLRGACLSEETSE